MMASRRGAGCVLSVLAAWALWPWIGPLQADPGDSFTRQVEADWLLQEEYRRADSSPHGVTPQADAAGAVDGVIDGAWGLHTELTERPWWQVDLERSVPIDRIIIWNRADGTAGRTAHLEVKLSNDGADWQGVYGHDGSVFYGKTDGKPLVVRLDGRQGRFVRVELPGRQYLHLDEVQVFTTDAPDVNVALHKPADQSSTSQWSMDHLRVTGQVDWPRRVAEILSNCRRMVARRTAQGVDIGDDAAALDRLASRVRGLEAARIGREEYLAARWLQRRLILCDPLLDFESVLFVKRVPGSYSHMSDQYYGWWSRPGGGLYLLDGFREGPPRVRCLSGMFSEPGSFLRPALSYDGRRVLFAWCRHDPHLAAERNKLDKANVPADAFYHLFEMKIDGTDLRQLTFGKYDDFDGRYLPDGRIVFLSTRRGQGIQVGRDTAMQTLQAPDLPDCYVRCGGGPERPVAVYTLHTLSPDGSEMCAISPFEMFEWTPDLAADGSILYSRWDYIDRDNMPFMSLWSIRPDGTNARIVYSNYTRSPHCTFEPRSIPGSHKIIFTASGHHAQTMGSLVLLDPTIGTEGPEPITRLTPEVCFPEIEGWPRAFFAHPWPLSERLYLVSWRVEENVREGTQREPNGMGLYLFDADGGLELLYRDPQIGSVCPIPVAPRPVPPVLVSDIRPDGPQEGAFLLTNVYRGLKTVRPPQIKALRIVAIPPKTHPTMNYPSLGITRDDPGKCVLGTVPVEADGSAHFRVPSGVIVFFQALDERGMAVQTMRSVTYAQPGQTLSCVGCHESRQEAPTVRTTQAARREPSRIAVGPEGSWPLRFDALVGPVLDRHCVRCHRPDGAEAGARGIDLSGDKAYEILIQSGTPNLAEQVMQRYREGVSTEGGCVAANNGLLAKLLAGHHDVRLDGHSLERLIVWMDTYGQRLGSFGPDQEQQLRTLRQRWGGLLIEREETRPDPHDNPMALKIPR